MAAIGNYASTPKNGAFAQVSVANTNRDGTGTVVTLMTAGASGSRIDMLDVRAVGTTTAGMVRLYVQNAAASATRLIQEIPVVAITPSGTIPAWNAQPNWPYGLILEAGAKLIGSTQNAETFNITPIVAGDF